MAVRLSEVFVEIGARTASFQKGIQQASTRLGRFGKSVTKVSSDNALALTAFAAAGALAFKSLVETAGAFDSAMRSVRAVSGATQEQFEELTAAAEKLGRETQFSASQAAEGMEFLAKAGFDANEVLGAIPGTLELAAAASLDLGSAADIVTNVLTGFNLEVSDLAKVNDVLTQAFISSNTDLRQLGQAMKFVGPVAAGFGQDIEDVVAILGSLGNAGIQASMAGTTLRGAMTRLASPSREAAEILERVGINVFDSAGKMRPFIEVLGDLESSTIKAEEVIKVFGLRAGPGIVALLSQGTAGIREFSNELRDSAGITSEIAQVKMEGFTGAVLELRSAFEGLTISLGKSGILEFTEELARQLAGVLRAAATLPKGLLAVAAGIAAIVTGGAGLLAFLGLAAIAFVKVNAALAELSLAFAATSAAASTTTISMSGVTAATSAFTVSLSALLIPLAAVAIAVGVATVAFIKWGAAIREADSAGRAMRDGLKSVNERMKAGFQIAREFSGATVDQARKMGNLNVTIQRLTTGIRGLATAQAQARDAASRQRIQAQIDELKLLRAELLKIKVVREETAGAGINLEDAQRRAFRATIAERRALLTAQLREAAAKRDEASFLEVGRQLEDLENAKVNNEEFKLLFADRTNAQILELAREQEAKTIAREFDLQEKRIVDEQRVAQERMISGRLTAINQQASVLFRTLFNKDLTAKEKRQQVFLQTSNVIQQQLTSMLIANLAKETAARKAAALAGVATDKAKTASGFFAAFAGVPFVGQALAVAAIAASFAVINSLLTFKKGGIVPGSGNSDSVPALLAPGELVVPKPFVRDFAGGGGRRGPIIGQLILQDAIIDSEERVERLAELVGENIMDKLSGDRRGIVD